MHCMVAWGREARFSPLSIEQHRELEEALDGHSWASPAPGIYVIALTYGQQERFDLQEKLKTKSEELGGEPVAILLSPPIEKAAGVYIGSTLSELWDDINKRSGHFEIIKMAAEPVGESDGDPALREKDVS